MQCPSCKSKEVFQSRKGNDTLRSLKRLLFVALRCHRCGDMFLRLRAFASSVPAPKSRS